MFVSKFDLAGTKCSSGLCLHRLLRLRTIRIRNQWINRDALQPNKGTVDELCSCIYDIISTKQGSAAEREWQGGKWWISSMWIEIFLNSNTEFKLFIHNMPVDLGFETSSMEMRCIPRKTKKRGMLIQYKPYPFASLRRTDSRRYPYC